MPVILLIIFSGVLGGYFLRNIPQMKHVGVVVNLIVLLLLFFLGVSIGANDTLVKNFSSIGFDAFVLTVGGILGSILCAKWVYNAFFKRKKRNSETECRVRL